MSNVKALVFLIITGIWSLSAWPRPGGDEAAPAPPPPALQTPGGRERVLTIGFLTRGSELTEARPTLDRLRRRLLRKQALVDELAAAGYSTERINLSGSDDPLVLIRQLRDRDVDLAFATAVIYGALFAPNALNPADYDLPENYIPILQFYRPEAHQHTQGGVYQKAVIFAGRESSLWGIDLPTDDERFAALDGREFALTDRWSAPGNIYPHLKLRERFGAMPAMNYLWVQSAEEVVKHVVSGLAAVGACDERTLKQFGVRAGRPMYRVLFETDLMPTDPILLRGELAPAVSPLGTELRVAIMNFFNGVGGTPPQVEGLTVAETEPRVFEDIARRLDAFEAIPGVPSPLAGSAGGRPAPPPTPPPAVPR